MLSESSNSSFSISKEDLPDSAKNFQEITDKGAKEEEKLLTKTLQFTTYSDLDIKTRQDYYSKPLENIGNQ